MHTGKEVLSNSGPQGSKVRVDRGKVEITLPCPSYTTSPRKYKCQLVWQLLIRLRDYVESEGDFGLVREAIEQRQ